MHEVPAVSRENGRAPPDYDEVDACEHIKHIEAMRKRCNAHSTEDGAAPC